jgi:hypothetical protein
MDGFLASWAPITPITPLVPAALLSHVLLNRRSVGSRFTCILMVAVGEGLHLFIYLYRKIYEMEEM